MHLTQDLMSRMNELEMRVEMDRAIADAVRVYDTYEQQVTHFHAQRAALERGYLTEDVMDSAMLLGIVDQAAKAGHKTVSSLSWLYRFTAVEPVILAGNRLIYRFVLPILTSQSYLLFKAVSMPVPVPHFPMHVMINISPLIGTSQRTGLLFFPEVCRGSSPVVCRSGPMYKANVYQCARGLVFNQTDLPMS